MTITKYRVDGRMNLRNGQQSTNVYSYTGGLSSMSTSHPPALLSSLQAAADAAARIEHYYTYGSWEITIVPVECELAQVNRNLLEDWERNEYVC